MSLLCFNCQELSPNLTTQLNSLVGVKGHCAVSRQCLMKSPHAAMGGQLAAALFEAQSCTSGANSSRKLMQTVVPALVCMVCNVKRLHFHSDGLALHVLCAPACQALPAGCDV